MLRESSFDLAEPVRIARCAEVQMMKRRALSFVIAMFAGVWISLLPTSTVLSAESAGLYRGRSIVTGQDNLAERERGTREALAQVLAKVAADRSVLDDPALVPILDRGKDWAVSYRYTDRKAGIQVSDEQGTRDRSYLLEVDFDEAAVDRGLRELGRKAWKKDRPRLAVELRVTDAQGSFLVNQSSERGSIQREVIEDVSREAVVPVNLPATPQANAEPADALLAGEMIVTPEGYWNTTWQLSAPGIEERWTVGPGTFDEAIASGIWGALERLRDR
jgi:hypothetical protein